MNCISRSPALIPVADSSVSPSKISFNEFAWMAYLAKDSSKSIARFNDSATLSVARNSLESCREWDRICQNPTQIFAAPDNLAMCSLYLETTTTRNAATTEIQSAISTCLISYCALAPLCSTDATTRCNASSLITSDGYLAPHSVGRCWTDICYTFPLSVNSDIAGVGVSRYY